MPRSSYSTPAQVDVVIYRTLPSNPQRDLDTVVKAFGELDVTFSNTLGTHDPVYFKATVDLTQDRPRVVEFAPLYGTISGAAKVYLEAYVELLEDALRRNKSLLGVS